MGYVCRDLRHGRRVRQHVGVRRVGQRAVALASLDAAPQLIGLSGSPDRAEVVIVVAQVPHGLRPDAAGPDVSVGRDLRRGHARHARNDLPMLSEGALYDLVVLAAKSLRDLGNAREALVAHAFEQRVYGDRVLLRRWRNAESDGVELDPFLRDLSDVRVRLELALDVLAQLRKRVDVEVRDDGVNPDRQIRVPLLQLLEAGIRAHRVRPVIADPANLVVLLPYAIERQVDDHLGLRRRLQHGRDAVRNDLVLDAVRRDVDDAGATV